ncbi:MAG: S4 domain-containing protein, partial [Microbacterium sp.]
MTQRLDAALAARGLVRSRTHAQTLIAHGLVTVDGRPVVKAATAVADDAVLEVAASDHYVSRAAHKLIAALDAFRIDPAGRVAL